MKFKFDAREYDIRKENFAGCVSEIEHSKRSRRFLSLQQRDRDVVYGHSGQGLSVERAVVSVAMHDQIGAVPVDHLGKP